MDRRRLLAVLGTAGTGGLAACIDREAASFHISNTHVVLDEPTRGDVTAEYEVENTGDKSGTQEVRLLRRRDHHDANSVSLGGGERTTGELTYTPPAEVSGLDRVVVATEDDLASMLIEREAAHLHVRDTNVTIDEPTRDDVTVKYEVENTGDRAGTQEVRLQRDGDIFDSISVSLDGGERTTGKLRFRLPAEVSDFYSVVVATDNSQATPTIVYETADFRVTDTDVILDEPNPGDVTITVEMENTGDRSGTRELRLVRHDGTLNTESIMLDGGETISVELSYTPPDDVGGTDLVHIVAEDVSVTERIDLPYIAVDLVDAPFGARADEEFTVTYQVRNQSSVEGSQDIVFEVADRHEGVESVTLGPRESTTRSVTYLPDERDAGTLPLTISSGGDVASTTVEIAPAESEPVVLDGAVRAESVGGFLSFSGETRAAARQQGGNHPNLPVDRGEPAVTIEAVIEDGQFESTSVNAPDIPPIPGIGVEEFGLVEEASFDLSAPEGITGEVDYDAGQMTASGLWRFAVDLTMSMDEGDDTDTTEDESDGDENTTEQQFHVDVPMDATTGESGALTGEFDNGPPVFTATLVDNETTIPAVDADKVDVSPVIAVAINELLGLPSEPGEFWLEVDFRFEAIE